jgi:hypothetical protein
LAEFEITSLLLCRFRALAFRYYVLDLFAVEVESANLTGSVAYQYELNIEFEYTIPN